MASSESEESGGEGEGEEWVGMSEREGWSDVKPAGEGEGGKEEEEVVAIAYTRQFREVMGYFRAVLAKDERSHRALELTEEAIKLNPGNYTVWHFRRLVLEALSIDLYEELRVIERIAESNYKNYQIWHHRRWTAQKLGPASASSELQFTEKALLNDAKNYHAWSHRQWAIRTLGGWEGELDYCSKLLQQDIYNNSAWNQRYFVLKNSPLLGDFNAMRDAELHFCIEAIHAAPSNESSWRYLRGLYKNDVQALINNKLAEQICLKELSIDKKCVFALDFLLDIICLGYKPSTEFFSLFGFDKQACSLAKFAGFICSHLQEVDAIRTCYWKWRQETLPPLDS